MGDAAAVEVRLNLARAEYEAEREAAGPGYALGPAAPLPADPDAAEASFIEPVTLVAAVSLGVLAERILNHWLTRRGQGVMIDARTTPPTLTKVAGVPQGFVVLVQADGKAETVKAAEAGVLAGVLGAALKRGG